MNASSSASAGLTLRLWKRLVLADALIMVPITFVWLGLMQIGDPASAAMLSLCVYLARMLLWSVHLWSVLRPVEAWLQCSTRLTDDLALLRAADAGLRRFRRSHTRVYTFGWAAYFGLVPLMGVVFFPSVLSLGPHDHVGIVLFVLAALLGAPSMSRPLANAEAEAVDLELTAALRSHSLEVTRTSVSLRRELFVQAGSLVLAPMCVVTMLAWSLEVRNARGRATSSAKGQLTAGLGQARDAEGGSEPLSPRPFEELPRGLRDLPGDEGGERVWFDISQEKAHVAVRQEGDMWLWSEAPVELDWIRFWTLFGLLCMAISVWAFVSISAHARSLTGPIVRLRETIHRVVEVGDLQEMGAIPVFREDDLGALTQDFNTLLATLSALAVNAQKLAEGKLNIEFTAPGELGDAFRRMVAEIHELVVQIHETTLEVSSAASEIQAQSRTQELASNQQAVRAEELRELMSSLAQAAAQIDAAADNVLENAEGTLATTAVMGRETASLDARSQGISVLLETIREVADRSDLLALNGSLEATRAGEAGRGFALVAGEMRRLAERVTGAVVNVREQVTGIAHASASTVNATEHSRALAEGTTAAAREISSQVQRQSEQTHDASLRVNAFAEVVTGTSAALTQTRAAAEDLRIQAEELERLVGRFELRG